HPLALTVGAVTLSTLLGLTLGTFAALHRGRAGDYLTMGFAIAGLSIPTFLIAIVGIIVFSLQLRWLPVSGAFSPASYILPTVTLSLHSAAVKARITRSSMLEVFGQDYLRTARAKGLRERVVIVRHALKNALIPISTIVGIQFGALLGGAFIIENIFGWPGIGRLATQAIFNRAVRPGRDQRARAPRRAITRAPLRHGRLRPRRVQPRRVGIAARRTPRHALGGRRARRRDRARPRRLVLRRLGRSARVAALRSHLRLPLAPVRDRDRRDPRPEP